MTLRTIASERKYRKTVVGDRIKVEYQVAMDENGCKYLEPCGTTDLQDYIQSHEPSVNLDNILDRYQMGDSEALERAQAYYADISELPGNMQEILAASVKGQQVFEGLPPEIKNIYGDSYVKFLVNPQLIQEWYESKHPEEQPVEPEEKPIKEMQKEVTD